jgi:L-threonylcarbamoyladenylate synthase
VESSVIHLNDPSDSIAKAATAIRAGHLVAFPTETVYGLGADAFNPSAVARIFEVKDRPFFDPLIVHIAALDELDMLAARLPDEIDRIRAAFWPGPLTLVLPKRATVPDIVTSGLPSVAVRWPAHPLAQQLIAHARTPVAAPSANLFGRISPTTAAHVRDQLGERVELIIDGGPCRVGVESTIISYMDGAPILLRHGGYAQEELERVMGPIATAQAGERPDAPGMLARHYAPRTPSAHRESWRGSVERQGLLSFRGGDDSGRFEAVEILSPRGDLREAATNLFSAMRRLDQSGLDIILMERLPDEGLGRAINDRIAKACASFF